jgi:hypothetical protein
MAEITYDEERIIDRPETNTAKDDDYVLIDSETNGMRCIKIEHLLGGGE